MPKIALWTQIPPAIRDHLSARMRDRHVGLDDLNRLRLWIESKPDVPEGRWFKDFGSFKLCGEASLPKTFLLRGQPATGKQL